ncbi:hypothetical protein BsWGS_07270 [Bradybaena similaris]
MMSLQFTFISLLTFAAAARSQFNCNFEDDLCGWTQAQDDDFDWERVEGMRLSASGNSFSARDHTQLTVTGFYMSTNSKEHLSSEKARLVSPIVNITGRQQRCFQFYYLMHGAWIGALNVYLSSNGTATVPVWSRTGTQGIDYQLGQVTIDTTTMVLIEGSGSSGNEDDVAIDDVSINDGPCSSQMTSGSISSLACDFELEDICGYSNVEGDDLDWYRSLGTVSGGKRVFDHTTGIAQGAFMTISGSSRKKSGSLGSTELKALGEYCMTFFYRADDADGESLGVFLWDFSTLANATLWMNDYLQAGDQWNKVQFSFNISDHSQVYFDAIFLSGSGVLSIDDISVSNGSCQKPPNCDFDTYDFCSWSNDLQHDNFDWEIGTFESDAQIFAPWRDADNHTYGGFIFLDMANNPNNSEAYLISETITVHGTQCFQFYYYPMSISNIYDKTLSQLNIYVITGTEFPGTLYWTHSMNRSTVFIQGKLPLQMNHSYRLVIGGYTTLGHSLSLDKLSLSRTNCTYTPLEAKPSVQTTLTTKAVTTPPVWQPSSSTGPHSIWDCDFETSLCHWISVSDNTTTTRWLRRQAATSPELPLSDHTRGQGKDGYFMTMGPGTGKLQSDTLFQAYTNYCLTFWFYLYGPADFEFIVQTTDSSTTTVFYRHDNKDTAWHPVVQQLPTFSSSFNIKFIYAQTTDGDYFNQIAIDDIHVSQGLCNIEAGPSCTFDRGLCSWSNSKGSDFNFTLSSGRDPQKGMITVDHTSQADLGSFIKASLNGSAVNQKAEFQSAKLSFNTSVCMRFYYFITASCDGDMSIETLGPQDKHPVLLYNIEGITYDSWQLVEVTIQDPQDIQVIFTVTAGHNKTGEVGYDDVTFTNGECYYKTSTDFESGFDVFHNVYSNDFNWVIASPSDGIFTWLPSKDYSTNSAQGHFAVASYNLTGSAGQKAELWSELYMPASYRCCSFQLYVYGKDPGTLNITLIDYMENSRTVVWSYTPTFGKSGIHIYGQFPHVYPGKYYVVFTVVMGADGGWALDSIRTSPTYVAVCSALPSYAAASVPPSPTGPPPQSTVTFAPGNIADCDFANDFCQWYIPNDIYFNWNRTNGDSTLEFAPQQGRPGGNKYFISLPRSASKQTALLRSQQLNSVPPGNTKTVHVTLRFWLNMAGMQIGQFFVQMDTLHGSQSVYQQDWATNSWQQIEIYITAVGPFSLTLEGRRGSYDLDSISVDDIELTNATVDDDDTVYKCTFESSDLCGFKQGSTDDMHWGWFGGDDAVISADHTTQTGEGHVVMVSQSEGKPGDTGRLISKTVPPMSGCLTLWILMGADGTAFRVYISRGGEEELLLQKRDAQGMDWIRSEAPVTSNVPFTIIFEAEELSNLSSLLAVDDFSLSNGACTTHGACSFERDMCTWKNHIRNGDDFDWIRGTGSTVGPPGPAVDSTLGTSDGYFMYIDGSGPYQYQQKAWLESETFSNGIQCLHFHYNMRGISVGTLNVYIVLLDSGNSTLLWSLSGDHGSDWKSAMVTVGANLLNYFVRFEGVLGFSVTSNIAIDDITFMPDACNIQPAEAKVLMTVSTTTMSPVTQQGPQTILEQCSFDDVSVCGFKNSISDNTWVMSSPDMLVSGTLKPFNGHTSDQPNTFIYAQVGNGLKENATARIVSPAYNVYNAEPKCLEFYYHMNGDQVGQLNVYIAPDGQQGALTEDMRLWSENFDAGPGWKKAHVPILQSSNYRVIFEAVRSKVDYYYGIDDLSIFDNACEPADSCDFEEDLCLWSNDGGETDTQDVLVYYWKRYQSHERTASFAPVVDHTRHSVSGYYMFVESSLADTGSVARLYSQVFPSSDSSYCFHFWYYMFGVNPGQLKVFARNSISSSSFYSDAVLWELDNPTGSGQQGDAWFLAQVNISKAYTKKPFMVFIEATVGSTLQAAFGVDDTLFEISDCETQPTAAVVTADALLSPNCDFEDGDTCDWSSVQYEMYKFTVTNAGGDFPLDHSNGAGKFILADSTKLPQNVSVFLQSPLLPPTFGTSCLTLWYNMQIIGMSNLSLVLITGGNDVQLWKAHPESSNEWVPVTINIQNNFDYKLLIIATVGTRDAGSVAVDDISLVHGACRRSEKIDFEEGFSGFTPTSNSNFNWTLQSASGSFIGFDHTYATSAGHILWADLSSIAANVKTAEIQSPLYPSAGDECLEFWYAKKGSSGGWLSVQISQSAPGFVADDSSPLWVTTTDTNEKWKRALVDISTLYPYLIIFQAAANNSQVNDVVAIDDIQFRTDACPSVVTCDFDVNNCGYVSPNTYPHWQAYKGVYANSLMPLDQTLQSNEGMYMQVSIPSSIPGTVSSSLISPLEKQMSTRCLSFWYYGTGHGTLGVFTQTTSFERLPVILKTVSTNGTVGPDFRSWKNVQVDINSTTPFSLVFEAKNQNASVSFAIDSIQLYTTICANVSSAASTQPTAGISLDPKKAMLGCDFENSDFCNFTTGNSGSFPWKLFSIDSKHSADTGVDFDHTKFNKYGHHIYMDASKQKLNATARLVSPSFIGDRYVCLSFYYAMYGRDVNQLNVYVSQGQTTKLYWTESDNQGDDWHHQMVDIGESPQPMQVIFEGVVGDSDESDIDLDDIWIFDESCPPPDYCDFEDSEMCKMDQDNLDNTNWVVQLAELASGSEPKTDHTYGTGEGHYLVMDMSKTQSGDEARILTRQYSPDSARCLSFWYHMSSPPNHSHSLTVTLQDERGIGTDLIVLRGFFQDEWNLAVFPLQLTYNFQVVFVGQSGIFQGDISIDDLRVSSVECGSYINCDFESQDTCGWKPVPGYSTPQWDQTFDVLTLNFSYLQDKAFHVSKIQSLIIPPALNDFCFTFNYFMKGGNVGYLNVSIEIEYPEAQSIVIFSAYGDSFFDHWLPALGESPQVDYGVARFVITGTTALANRSYGPDAAFRLFDIKLVLQSCDDWLSSDQTLFTCQGGQQITPSFVCDFHPDCPDKDDETNCGSCDFETSYCKWDDDSSGDQEFTAVLGIPNKVFTDLHPGKFLTIQRAAGTPGGSADLVLDQEIGPSPYNCAMVFSYYMSLDSQASFGNLFVSIEEDSVSTVVWQSSQTNSTNWQTAYVDVGSINNRFQIHFTSKYLPFENAMGIDDIQFSGCSYAENNAGPCPTEFKCMSNGACIDNATKLCDFTYECSDQSDEDPSMCGEYLMDNFEDSFGDWSQDDKDDFDWSRHSGSWISSSSGPRRDHTLGTHYGHYLIFDSSSHADGQIARLLSPEFLPTQSGDCEIRFYYHMYGVGQGQLTLYIRSVTTNKMQQLGQYFTGHYDSWLFSNRKLTSSDTFQVVFEGKVVGQHSTDIGLDDITFTPQCQLKTPSTHRPGTKKTSPSAAQTIVTAKSGITVQPSTTRKTSPTAAQTGVTAKSGTTVQPSTTAISGATAQTGITAKASGTSRSDVTGRPTIGTTTAGSLPTREFNAAHSSTSDSWRVPVGVVLGLLALVAILVIVIIYLRRTRRLTWLAFPLLRRPLWTTGGDSNPMCEYDSTSVFGDASTPEPTRESDS